MLLSSAATILERLDPTDKVLDVGGWGQPFGRADWVLDHMPYPTRALLDRTIAGPERFTEQTWVQRDICARAPWPFEDAEFDFAICSHTLEDVRDPVFVCGEICRVARAGYIEVPSRLEEQSWGFQGPWVGWGHHHWLVDILPGAIEFVFKHDAIHGRAAAQFTHEFRDSLAAEERVQTFWWEGGFEASEKVFTWPPDELFAYLDGFVEAQLKARGLAATKDRHDGGSRLRHASDVLREGELRLFAEKVLFNLRGRRPER